MREVEIKAKFLAFLRASGAISQDTILASEYPLGGKSVRCDLAYLADLFVGVEIKSEFDTLKRLPAQLAQYQRTFDKTVLVIAAKHEQALRCIHCGDAEVWAIDDSGDLRLIARGRVRTVGIRALSRTAQAFKERFSAPSRQFWKLVRRREISPENLNALSRFKELRERAAALSHARSDLFAPWASAA